MITENNYNYTHLISGFTTDNRTLIDHLFKNIIDEDEIHVLLRATSEITKQYGFL